METTDFFSPENMMTYQVEMDNIKLVNGLKDNIAICQERINHFNEKIVMWNEIKDKCEKELNDINKKLKQ